MWPVRLHAAEANSQGSSERIAERLLRSRTIMISSGIEEETVENVIRDLVLMEQDNATEPVTVYINTPGGAADCGLAIYDLFRFTRLPVTAVVTGLCASAGVIVFLGAREGRRMALPNARFMIHEPRFLSASYGQASDLAITAKELLKMKEHFNTIVAEATGKTVDRVTKDTRRDFWLSAEEAKDYGLISRVIHSRDEL
jgi:ATP-dependent Clp protease protease subunit